MGVEADAVLTSIRVFSRRPERLDHLDAFFNVRTNIIFERARFNRRNQKEEESAEQYITTLYRLVETCGYGDLKDEILRDSSLTLNKAKMLIRQREAVREQQGQLQQQGDGSISQLDSDRGDQKPRRWRRCRQRKRKRGP